jgi:tyrosine-protein phosphatase SIW14
MSAASVSVAALLAESFRAKDEDDDAEYEELIPPENFAMIEKGLYRSRFRPVSPPCSGG